MKKKYKIRAFPDKAVPEPPCLYGFSKGKAEIGKEAAEIKNAVWMTIVEFVFLPARSVARQEPT